MTNDRFEGIDLMRAVMSVFVVVWHMDGGGKSLIWSARYFDHAFTASDFVNFHVLLLAVPSFILISCFLHVARGVSAAKLKKRLKRLSILLAFWPLAYIVFMSGYSGLRALVLYPYSLGDFVITLLSVAQTVYYFFICLMLCLLLTHAIVKMKPGYQLVGFIVSSLLVACIPGLTKITSNSWLSAAWSPLNFLPYPFAAVLIAQNRDYIRTKMLMLVIASLVLSVLIAFVEWKYSVDAIFFGQYNRYAIPSYMRASLVFSTIPLAILAIESRMKTNRVVKYMATYSLALYCIHPFFLVPVRSVVWQITQNTIVYTYLSITLVVVFSYAMAALLKLFLQEELVT